MSKSRLSQNLLYGAIALIVVILIVMLVLMLTCFRCKHDDDDDCEKERPLTVFNIHGLTSRNALLKRLQEQEKLAPRNVKERAEDLNARSLSERLGFAPHSRVRERELNSNIEREGEEEEEDGIRSPPPSGWLILYAQDQGARCLTMEQDGTLTVDRFQGRASLWQSVPSHVQRGRGFPEIDDAVYLRNGDVPAWVLSLHTSSEKTGKQELEFRAAPATAMSAIQFTRNNNNETMNSIWSAAAKDPEYGFIQSPSPYAKLALTINRDGDRHFVSVFRPLTVSDEKRAQWPVTQLLFQDLQSDTRTLLPPGRVVQIRMSETLENHNPKHKHKQKHLVLDVEQPSGLATLRLLRPEDDQSQDKTNTTWWVVRASDKQKNAVHLENRALPGRFLRVSQHVQGGVVVDSLGDPVFDKGTSFFVVLGRHVDPFCDSNCVRFSSPAFVTQPKMRDGVHFEKDGLWLAAAENVWDPKNKKKKKKNGHRLKKDVNTSKLAVGNSQWPAIHWNIHFA